MPLKTYLWPSGQRGPEDEAPGKDIDKAAAMIRITVIVVLILGSANNSPHFNFLIKK